MIVAFVDVNPAGRATVMGFEGKFGTLVVIGPGQEVTFTIAGLRADQVLPWMQGGAAIVNLTVSSATGLPPKPPIGGCVVDLGEMTGRTEAVNGTWASGCDSQARAGRQARYYTFTLAQQSEVTITLESNDTDTYLYLREGDIRSGTALNDHREDDDAGGDRNAQIQESLNGGTYTIEATTYYAGTTGDFILTIVGLADTGSPSPSDPCVQTVTGDRSINGEWGTGCDSQTRDGSHARYYTFTLAQESEVTITLESGIDTYLYLRQGDARSGTALNDHAADDDAGGDRNAQIHETLGAGTYTIEATTYDDGAMGSFTLTLIGLGAAHAAQSCSVGLTLAPEEGCSHQDFTIEVDDSGVLLMRFTGNRVDFSSLSLARSGNSWTVESLP